MLYGLLFAVSLSFILKDLNLKVLAYNPEYSMLVTYGEPTDSWDPIPIDTSSWDTCVRLCYLDTYCIVAHQTPQFCRHYAVGKVNSAKRLTSADDSLLAIKANKTANAACQTELTVVSQTVYIKNSSLPKLSTSYQLTLDGDDFKFTYSLTGYCPTGWQAFFRSTTIYCISVNTDFTTSFNNPTAIQRCAAMGATLAGLETDAERVWVTNQVYLRLGNEKVYANTAVWISGMRKGPCNHTNVGGQVACQGLNAFTFSDAYLQYKMGYQFVPGQPDSYNTGIMQNCIQVWVMKNTTDEKHGKVDDSTCSYSNGTVFAIRGYACGMPYVVS